MGLFSKKLPCPICGGKISWFLPTKIEGEYICDTCRRHRGNQEIQGTHGGRYHFPTGEVQECPSCEKNHIRLTTEEETGRLQKLLKQAKPTLRIKEEQTL